jgi:hypothetical protein
VPSLVDAAEASGGRAQRGDLRGLIRTVDQVRSDLDNQYRVRYRSTGPGSVEVQVATAGGVLSGTVDLSAPSPTVPPRRNEAGAPPSTQATGASDDGGGGGAGAAAVVAVVLVLLAAGTMAALLLLRRRRSTGPPAPAPVVLDLRETPEPAPDGEPSATTATEPGPTTAPHREP